MMIDIHSCLTAKSLALIGITENDLDALLLRLLTGMTGPIEVLSVQISTDVVDPSTSECIRIQVSSDVLKTMCLSEVEFHEVFCAKAAQMGIASSVIKVEKVSCVASHVRKAFMRIDAPYSKDLTRIA